MEWFRNVPKVVSQVTKESRPPAATQVFAGLQLLFGAKCTGSVDGRRHAYTQQDHSVIPGTASGLVVLVPVRVLHCLTQSIVSDLIGAARAEKRSSQAVADVLPTSILR